MLVSGPALGERRRVVAGAFAPLADSLASDLSRLVDTTDIYIPDTKARLTRVGGRCPTCGTTLEFDPWSPHRHRCARCATDVTGAEHDQMWIMWYQLWLAERAVHAAALFATRGDPAHRALAERILSAYTACYLRYPNKDNVLGPTRVFFSTYLESIWVVQLACALDLLETAGGGTTALGAALRSDIFEPSAGLIQEYDEGLSNRQVWNNAALLACSALLGKEAIADNAVFGPSGLLTHLEHALFADGTWYEGENYHLFAHRGLWYAVTVATALGLNIPNELRQRFQRAFETPFLTALPDFTFPARRDSQYRVSLRQWRIAESCELGLVEAPSDVLAAALGELYRSDIARGETGRDRSTAEAERNVAASRLTRADLGWKSLLFAAQAPVATNAVVPPPGSVLLPDQGYAVLRRDNGRAYVALDYGASGGGHGHPDRLNLWLVVGDARILEDVGTGSYVDPSLHWYRSTLAHNAPVPMLQSQQRVDGELIAHDERGDFGWILARAALTPAVDAERAIIAGPDYVVDELIWSAPPGNILDLPFHIPGQAPSIKSWTEATLTGADGVEDGFPYLTGGARSEQVSAATIESTIDGQTVRLWLAADATFVLWRVRGPGPPNEQPRDFFLARFAEVRMGRIRTVIDWTGAVQSVQSTEDLLVVTRRDGTRHSHSRREDEWHINADGRAAIVLAGRNVAPELPQPAPIGPRQPRPVMRIPRVSNADSVPGALARDDMVPALRFRLGSEHYRRSEQSWEGAGKPAATVAFAVCLDELHIDVAVEKYPLAFAPARAENPLDNEHPDINSDGVQLYLSYYKWLLVPETPAPNVRITPRHGETWEGPHVEARWTPTDRGYSMRVAVLPWHELALPGDVIPADVIVNEMSPDRERRRGQLVLSGGRDEWVYLRGDRQHRSYFVHLTISDA
ncbi:MAG: heparinase II/III domain-containing protein [Gemmatimonadaceae bacterium]